MKDYDKNEGSSYIHYWDGYSLHGWAMLLKLPVNHFQWIEDASQFNENFIKIYYEENDKGYFFEVDVHYIKKINKCNEKYNKALKWTRKSYYTRMTPEAKYKSIHGEGL